MFDLRKHSLGGFFRDGEFHVKIGGSRRASSHGVDVQSPVVEEGWKDQQASESYACTGCGTLPTAAFVTLVSCGDLPQASKSCMT